MEGFQSWAFSESCCKRRLKSVAGVGLKVQHLVNEYPGTREKSILSIFEQLMEFGFSDEIASWTGVWNGAGDSCRRWPPGYGCGE